MDDERRPDGQSEPGASNDRDRRRDEIIARVLRDDQTLLDRLAD